MCAFTYVSVFYLVIYFSIHRSILFCLSKLIGLFNYACICLLIYPRSCLSMSSCTSILYSRVYLRPFLFAEYCMCQCICLCIHFLTYLIYIYNVRGSLALSSSVDSQSAYSPRGEQYGGAAPPSGHAPSAPPPPSSSDASGLSCHRELTGASQAPPKRKRRRAAWPFSPNTGNSEPNGIMGLLGGISKGA